MFKELFGRGRIVGPGELSGSEIGIERNGLLEMLQRILGEQLLGQGAALQELGSRVA